MNNNKSFLKNFVKSSNKTFNNIVEIDNKFFYSLNITIKSSRIFFNDKKMYDFFMESGLFFVSGGVLTKNLYDVVSEKESRSLLRGNLQNRILVPVNMSKKDFEFIYLLCNNIASNLYDSLFVENNHNDYFFLVNVKKIMELPFWFHQQLNIMLFSICSSTIRVGNGNNFAIIGVENNTMNSVVDPLIEKFFIETIMLKTKIPELFGNIDDKDLNMLYDFYCVKDFDVYSPIVSEKLFNMIPKQFFEDFYNYSFGEKYFIGFWLWFFCYDCLRKGKTEKLSYDYVNFLLIKNYNQISELDVFVKNNGFSNSFNKDFPQERIVELFKNF